jgi:N-hydroxyarylamine O-acetyltransferase
LAIVGADIGCSSSKKTADLRSDRQATSVPGARRAAQQPVETVVPGLYPGRTRHIHVKVQRPGGSILTTQLYVPDEPRNATDGNVLGDQSRRMDTPFDLDSYLKRIGLTAPRRADADTLKALQRAHLDAIPFENLEIQMGGAIRLDPETLQAKMVRRQRGGYCFEQNALFAMALRAIGFAPLTCEARVRQGAAGVVRPRTHMILLVPCEGRHWLTDVGFGGDGAREPVPLDIGSADPDGWTFRVAEEGNARVLQVNRGDEWEDLYAFTVDPVHPVDYVMASWFTSTFPTSPFVTSLTAQRIRADARHILRNLTYTITRGRDVETREIARADLVALLRGAFGLDVPADARFRALDTPAGSAEERPA